MPDWNEDSVTADGARMHYHATGGNGRPLATLHSFTDNGMCWGRVVRALAGDYNIMVPDLRGHGLSECVEPGQSVDLAADLIDLIDQAGLERTDMLDMPPWQEIITDIACSNLLITGDPERGAIVTPEVSQGVARQLPQAEIVRIPGAGHSIRQDRCDATSQVITRFLQAHRNATC
jgi:pimeloyl-ACP methyl ester carboxylesterase